MATAQSMDAPNRAVTVDPFEESLIFSPAGLRVCMHQWVHNNRPSDADYARTSQDRVDMIPPEEQALEQHNVVAKECDNQARHCADYERNHPGEGVPPSLLMPAPTRIIATGFTSCVDGGACTKLELTYALIIYYLMIEGLIIEYPRQRNLELLLSVSSARLQK